MKIIHSLLLTFIVSISFFSGCSSKEKDDSELPPENPVFLGTNIIDIVYPEYSSTLPVDLNSIMFNVAIPADARYVTIAFFNSDIIADQDSLNISNWQDCVAGARSGLAGYGIEEIFNVSKIQIYDNTDSDFTGGNFNFISGTVYHWIVLGYDSSGALIWSSPEWINKQQ